MHKAFIGMVIGIGEEWPPTSWQAHRVHCKAMVLGSDEATLGALMEAWLVVSPVPIPGKELKANTDLGKIEEPAPAQFCSEASPTTQRFNRFSGCFP